MNTLVRTIRRLIPKPVFRFVQPVYHYLLALLAALVYRFPARKITVIGVTGTKGKTTTVELIAALLRAGGHRIALSSSLRFIIGEREWKNEYKMTMPGRFFMQRFLHEAVRAGCRYAIIEMTSEGAVQYRHLFLAMNVFVFTNLAPEHIESHGSFEAYRAAKRSILRALERSQAQRKYIVINRDDPSADYFLKTPVQEKITYGAGDVSTYTLLRDGIVFLMDGVEITTRLAGLFNLYNALAAIAVARREGVSLGAIASALDGFVGIPGRMEYIDEGQAFMVVVDYAHTPDSLEKVYEFFALHRKICVLGSCGGGRDVWKRPKLGEIAARHCDEVIVTDEDPYDEDPRAIIDAVAEAIPETKRTVIPDRKDAIREAVRRARTGDAVIITGKGAEPWMMGPNETKTPWDDRAVARDALREVV